jgi:hypothetical protein
MAEGLRLALQNIDNVFGGIATLELPCEWMCGQIDTRLFLICLQGIIEKGLKTSEC